MSTWNTENTVRIAQELVPTNNRIRSDTFCSATVAAGATHVHTAMWKKYTTNVKDVVVRGQLGDTVTLSFGEDTTVGVMSGVTANGATTLAFDMTPFPMMISGSEVRLVDGNGASAYMEIANIAAGTVTLQNAMQREFAAGAYVQVREVAASSYTMEDDIIFFGKGSMVAALFPANTVCTFRYTNHSANPVYVLCNVHFWR